MFFIFCAIISIFLWVGNWICWYRECCCFNAFDDYSNKAFVWWLSFICFCGIIACCIAGFVTANRFGFCSYAIQCAYERIYYDSLNGQIKTTYPKWEGTNEIEKKLKGLDDVYNTIKKITPNDLTFKIQNPNCELLLPAPTKYIETLCTMGEEERKELYQSLGIGISSINNLYNYQQIDMPFDKNKKYQDDLENIESGLKQYKEQFISDFEYWVHVARGLGKIVPLIYFAILLTVVVLGCTLLIIYYCNCIQSINQDLYIFPMHIIWNILRFFIFSFFMYGFGFGALFLLSRDSIGYLQYILEKQPVDSKVISKNARNYFNYCLKGENMFEEVLGNPFPDEFIKNTISFENWKNNIPDYNGDQTEIFNNYKKYLIDAYEVQQLTQLTQYQKIYNSTGSIYSILDCSFIRSEFNLLYNALWDFSWETRVLCALSCFIAFFGVLGVYGFLWSMYILRRRDNGGFRYVGNNNEGDDDSNRPKENSRLKKRLIRPPQIRNNNNNENNNNSQEMQNQNNGDGDEDEIS